MRSLGKEREVAQLAAGLQVDWRQNAVENIIGVCYSKISKWLQERPKISSMKELEDLVCRKLKLVFESVWTDEDLVQIIRKYVGLGEPVFATLKQDLDAKTFATLIERRRIDGSSKDRYVAVIDCRGPKAARRFFTRWHEIAHILTLYRQLELPLHRSRGESTPTERLMDAIAGEIGFYEPLFKPILLQEIAREPCLTFAVVERVRERFCPEASFHSTLNACVDRLGTPALVLEARMGFKAQEQERMNSRQQDLIPSAPPQPKLRVRSVAGNKWAAGTQLKIHKNMRVPASSIIHALHSEKETGIKKDVDSVEFLGMWRHSNGDCLSNIRVRVQARQVGDSVLALILPA